jgi:hypothetical protein
VDFRCFWRTVKNDGKSTTFNSLQTFKEIAGTEFGFAVGNPGGPGVATVFRESEPPHGLPRALALAMAM